MKRKSPPAFGMIGLGRRGGKMVRRLLLAGHGAVVFDQSAEAVDEGVPVPVLTTAPYERFSSRGEADFQDKRLSALRFQFGGHVEKPIH